MQPNAREARRTTGQPPGRLVAHNSRSTKSSEGRQYFNMQACARKQAFNYSTASITANVIISAHTHTRAHTQLKAAMGGRGRAYSLKGSFPVAGARGGATMRSGTKVCACSVSGGRSRLPLLLLLPGSACPLCIMGRRAASLEPLGRPAGP